MKRKYKVPLMIISLIFLFSCGGYETKVINTIHQDGSITRIVSMRNDKPEFDPEEYRVPVDSTWNIEITMEIEEEDTTWFLTAEKHFNSVEELNAAYDCQEVPVSQSNSGGSTLITVFLKKLTRPCM